MLSLRHLATLLSLIVLSACSRRAPPPVRLIDLLDGPNESLGNSVIVDVFERVDPVGGSGLMRVDVPERGGMIALAPGAVQGSSFIAPMRVHGTLGRRLPDAPASRTDELLLRVEAVEPLAEPPPVFAPAASAMDADRSHWDRRLVIYEGTWTTGFESSSLDRVIWVGAPRSAIEGPYDPRRQRAGESDSYRVRVTGRIFAHGEARYGHLGMYSMALDATRLEVLERLTRPNEPSH